MAKIKNEVITALSPNQKERGPGYKSEYDELAYRYCLLHDPTDDMLGDFFNVKRSTIARWKRKYPSFDFSVKKGKLLSDGDVVHALYKRAVGYEYEQDEYKVVDKKLIKVKIKKHVPPDSIACFFILKNRNPNHWADKPAPKDIPITAQQEELVKKLESADPSELAAFYKKLMG